MDGDVGAGIRGGGERRGVSLPAFLATLVVLLLFLLVALEFVNRWTRIPAPEAPSPALRMTLDLAVRTLTRDLGAAASGRLPAIEAIRPVTDNTPAWRAFTGTVGQTTEIRGGTDQIGLRGILRTSPLLLEPSERTTGRPAATRVKVYEGAPGGSRGRGGGESGFAEAAAILRSRSLAGARKRFFVAGDPAGGYAVARLVAFADRTAASKEGCPPAPDGCHLELTLDFTDPDAVRMNPREAAEASRGLGPLSWGGLFDDIVYFVARGPKGRPPDYFVVNDPLSLAYPRPFLAVAENVGGDRWDVARVADEIENLQAAWAVGRHGEPEEWRADRPEARPLLPSELSVPGLELRAVRIALVAKGTERTYTGNPAEALEPFLPFNAPRGDVSLAPLGWTPSPRTRVGFSRETRYLLVRARSSP
ncbi:MAG TPA: hypothetical protein VL084_08650 [Thermoanaerobaculia bacterium]|nr:hypothetical protein [Thermoanaerobaculia bacterium]